MDSHDLFIQPLATPITNLPHLLSIHERARAGEEAAYKKRAFFFKEKQRE